jgi:hypothetical protein
LPQVPDQSYCAQEACQRERRKLWQRTHREQDADYRENQARAQEAWLARNPDYWRDYRARHPEYAEANRKRQRERTQAKREQRALAKMDSTPQAEVPPGRYVMTVLAPEHLAKMNVSFVVQLVPLEPSSAS